MLFRSVLGEVDVDRAHRHAAQQRGDVEERADAAEREQQGDGDDQPVVGGVFFEQHPLHHEAEEAAEAQDPGVDGDRKKDVLKVEASARSRPRIGDRGEGDGDGDAVLDQPDDVVERHDLQERVDEVPLGPRLPDRHHGRGRRGRRGECGQNDREGEIESQDVIDDGEDEERGQARLQNRYDDHLDRKSVV